MPRYYGRNSYRPYYPAPTPDYNLKPGQRYPQYPATPHGKQHKHFASPAALAEWAASLGVGTRSDLHYWHGGDNYYDRHLTDLQKAQRGLTTLIEGDDTYVEEAQRYMDSVREKIESPSTRWGHALNGAFPDVPAFLAGDPEHMWYREPTTNDRTPLRIYVGLSCSWTITPQQMRARGLIIAAFAMAMLEVRPVTIIPFMNGHDYGRTEHAIVSFDIDTRQLVLSQLVACMSDIYATRHVWIPAIFAINCHIDRSVPFASIKRSDIPNIQPGDMYLPPLTHADVLTTDPLNWLRANVAHYSDPDHDYDIYEDVYARWIANNSNRNQNQKDTYR